MIIISSFSAYFLFVAYLILSLSYFFFLFVVAEIVWKARAQSQRKPRVQAAVMTL
jgi:predicted membrane metal-binding protein